VRPLVLLLFLTACVSPEPELEPELLFGFPVAEPELISGVVLMDHDPEVHDDSTLGGAICTNFEGEGFPECYDEHDGSDFLLDGGFETMDAGSATIIAAADGVVLSTEEGQYDHCHTEDFEVTCDGHPVVANHVILEHGDGLVARYWHLMTDSVMVEVGDEVACGDALGMMGSSGNSTMPHLHFEVSQGMDGEPIDPFAGEYSQPESLWIEQVGAYGLPSLGCVEGS